MIVRTKSGELVSSVYFIALFICSLLLRGRFLHHWVFLCPGEAWLFCKGADSSIFPRVKQEEVERIRMHVERNATVGAINRTFSPSNHLYFLVKTVLISMFRRVIGPCV